MRHSTSYQGVCIIRLLLRNIKIEISFSCFRICAIKIYRLRTYINQSIYTNTRINMIYARNVYCQAKIVTVIWNKILWLGCASGWVSNLLRMAWLKIYNLLIQVLLSYEKCYNRSTKSNLSHSIELLMKRYLTLSCSDFFSFSLLIHDNFGDKMRGSTRHFSF